MIGPLAGGKSLRRNTVAFGLSKAAKFATPLVTLPYLTRVLGLETVGLLALAEAVVGYLLIATDYGFNLTAARHVPMRRPDQRGLSRLVLAVLTVKGVIAAVALSGVGLALFVAGGNSPLAQAIGVLSLSVIGGVMYCPWLFQGAEDADALVASNLLASTFTVGAVFLFVDPGTTAAEVACIYAVAWMLNGLVSLLWAVRGFGLTVTWPSGAEIQAQLREGAAAFGSVVAGNVYSGFGPILLGFWRGPAALGEYKIAYTIAFAAAEALAPVAMSAYGRLARDLDRGMEAYWRTLAMISRLTLPAYAVLAGTLFLGAPLAVMVFAPPEVRDGPTLLLRILAVLPLLQGLCSYGTIHLMAMRKDREYLGISLAGAAANVILCLALVPGLGQVGVAVSYVLTATVLSVLMVRRVALDASLSARTHGLKG